MRAPASSSGESSSFRQCYRGSRPRCVTGLSAETRSEQEWRGRPGRVNRHARSAATARAAVISKTTTLLLATGETLEVAGPLEEIAKQLENAARSSAGTLAWFNQAQANERLGVNPAYVVLLRRGLG